MSNNDELCRFDHTWLIASKFSFAPLPGNLARWLAVFVL
jgi:hypothetical protein